MDPEDSVDFKRTAWSLTHGAQDFSFGQLGMAVQASVDEILGRSPWSIETRKRVKQLAPHAFNVTLTGPVGSGKQFLARMIHRLSRRFDHPIVPVDLSLYSEEQFHAQLFGHVDGGLPQATGEALGCLRAADGGTLYLSQVTSLPLGKQQELFDTLSRRSVIPLGGEEPQTFNVRIITSSARDLQKEVQDRKLLPELYTLLDAISLCTIPLAERREDIQLLADQFLAELAADLEEPRKRLTEAGVARLESYIWPGNITELREAVERAGVSTDEDTLTAKSFRFLPDT